MLAAAATPVQCSSGILAIEHNTEAHMKRLAEEPRVSPHTHGSMFTWTWYAASCLQHCRACGAPFWFVDVGMYVLTGMTQCVCAAGPAAGDQLQHHDLWGTKFGDGGRQWRRRLAGCVHVAVCAVK
jgi:hypothetical protein